MNATNVEIKGNRFTEDSKIVNIGDYVLIHQLGYKDPALYMKTCNPISKHFFINLKNATYLIFEDFYLYENETYKMDSENYKIVKILDKVEINYCY